MPVEPGSEKMGKNTLEKIGPKYRTLISKMAWISAVFLALLCALVVIQMMFARHNIRIDLTESRKFSLSEQSLKILEGLEDRILIKAFYAKGKYYEVYDQLSKFSVKSSLINIEMVNMDLNPKLSGDYDIIRSGQCVLFRGERYRKIQASTEAKVISAIIALTTKEKREILFLYGHGERRLGSNKDEGLSVLGAELHEEYYELEDRALLQGEVIESGVDLVVFCGPRKDLLVGEAEVLDEYLKKGGSVLILLDPGTFPEFEKFLTQYGIHLRDDIITDEKNRFINKDKFSPIVSVITEHIITEGIKAAIFFSMARSVSRTKKQTQGVEAQNFLMSSQTSQSIPYEATKHRKIYPGPVPVAALAQVKNEKEFGSSGRLVVFGDSDFVNNGAIPQLGNKDLILNAVSWLVNREDLIGSRPGHSPYAYRSLTPGHARLLFWSTVVIMPGLGFFLAALFFVRRQLNT